MKTKKPSKKFMLMAIKEAQKACNKGDYAIGAVVEKDGKIIGVGGQRIKINNDPTAHAEVVAIRQACRKMKNRFLNGAVLYTTHEPCPMCASAAIWARLDGIVFGSTIKDMADFKKSNGNKDWTWRTIDVSAEAILKKGDPQLFLVKNFLREECLKLFHS